MIEHILETGDVGRLRLQDRTDESSMSVEMWVQSLSPVAIAQLPWAYSINTAMTSWKSFNFQNTTMWQRLGSVYVGTAEKFTLHLGNTGTSHLGGPTDFEISLNGYSPPGPSPSTQGVRIKVGNAYKRAVPYVKVDGVWRQAEAHVRGERGWSRVD